MTRKENLLHLILVFQPDIIKGKEADLNVLKEESK